MQAACIFWGLVLDASYVRPQSLRISQRVLMACISLALILLALLPRVLNLGQFATMDEVEFWFDRSAAFLTAIRTGNFAALAMTTKSPALLLAPVVATIALYAAWAQPGEHAAPLLRSLLVWGATTVVAAVAIWPALWAAPLAAYEQIRIGYTAEGTQPHQLGNYFLGQSDPAPGLAFYPVAIALRLTPLTLAGLLALPWAWRRVALPAPAQRSLAGLAWFVLAFTLAMSLFAKKFNRYIEPVFPALDILAALGLIWLCATLASAWSRHRHQGFQRAQTTLLGGLVLAAALNAAWWHPYYIVAYNQLLGGVRAGA